MSSGAKKAKSGKAQSKLLELLNDAQTSNFWGEYARAAALYRRVLEQANQDADSTALAEILEGLQRMLRAIEETESELPSLRAAVEAEPEDPEKHFHLALKLTALGREEEALKEYKTALENPEGLCAECFKDLWNNIGWYYFRQGEYQEALKWFDQTYVVANSDEAFGKGNCALAMENRMLAYAELGMRQEAENIVREYISRYGRIPWPARRALSKLRLDADAVYVESVRMKLRITGHTSLFS